MTPGATRDDSSGMIEPSKGSRRRFWRRGATSLRMKDAARRARVDAQVVARREREIARRAQVEASRHRREEFMVWAKGVGLETRRRLRPLEALLRRIAPPISRALLLLARVPAAVIAFLLDAYQAISRRLRARIDALAARAGQWLLTAVTPVRTLAAVAAVAAIALGASQFANYRGVAVGAPQYTGEVGAAAPAPLTDLETAGSAHLYVLLGLAGVALYLIWATARGHWRLGRAIGLVGLAGIAVSLLIDAPQGLDAGRAGVAYYGTDAQLIEGFWAQLSASAVLVLCGPLLGWHVKRAAGDDGRERQPAPLTAARLRTET